MLTIRSRHAWLAAALFLAAPQLSALPQTDALVRGRVVDEGGTINIRNAIVILEGHGSTLTAEDGSFFFYGVAPREYTLTVEAFGYTATTRTLVVNGNTTVVVSLPVDPLQLDELLVESRTISIGGLVREAETGRPVMGAEIVTNQESTARTSPSGKFSLNKLWPEARIGLGVRAFGFLPVDTVFMPSEDEDYEFEVKPDSIILRMIETQVRRLEVRADKHRDRKRKSMDRERILWMEGATLGEVLQTEYARYPLGGLRCFLVDDKPVPIDFHSGAMDIRMGTEFERVEVLFEGRMLRAYTREFMREMIRGRVILRTPSYAEGGNYSGLVEPLCI